MPVQKLTGCPDVPRWPLPTAEGRPLVFAHRGASVEAPENTMAAFRIALEECDVDGIELDVQLCASGELVVFHDDDCMRLAGSPLKVADATLEQLRALELPPHDGVPERIPTLEEVLELVPKGKTALIELKASKIDDAELGIKTAELLKRLPDPERFFIHSFNPTSIRSFHLAFPEAPTAILMATKPHFDGPTDPEQASLARQSTCALALHPEGALMTPVNVRLWKDERPSVWTVDDPQEVKRLIDMRVNGIITNDPRNTRVVVRDKTGR